MNGLPKKNRISACLPVYNRSETLLKALLSVSHQSVPPDEVIICDFASSDNCDEIITDWINNNVKSLNIKYIKYDNSPKFVEDWNMTIQHCRFEYIAILEGDDIWPLEYIRDS